MTITHHQCPKCGYEQIDLLSTTSELKYYCPRCEFRFSADRRSLPPAECVLEDSVPVSGCTPAGDKPTLKLSDLTPAARTALFQYIATLPMTEDPKVLAERERCAKIAEAKNAERNCGICDDAGEIAAEIRSGK